MARRTAINFVVWSSPRVAFTPAIRSLGAQAGFLADSLTQAFNAGLTQAIGQLTFALPGSSFARLDAYQLQTAIVAAPAAFNLSNVTTACVTPNTAPFTCENVDEYLFWDGIHPTRAGHAILAQALANILQ